MDVRVGAYGVIVAEDRILLTHWNEHGRTGWTLPGGGMEEYETPQQAAVREIREETGFDTEILDILGVDSMYRRRPRTGWSRATDRCTRSASSSARASSAESSLTKSVVRRTKPAGCRWLEVPALPTVSLVGIALGFLADRG